MEGGIVTVNSAENLDKLRILRAHGWLRNTKKQAYDHKLSSDIDPRYAFVNWGLNVRPTVTAFGIRQLEKLEEFNKEELITQASFRVLKPILIYFQCQKFLIKQNPLGLVFLSWFPQVHPLVKKALLVILRILELKRGL